jgi:hypothetical protein
LNDNHWENLKTNNNYIQLFGERFQVLCPKPSKQQLAYHTVCPNSTTKNAVLMPKILCNHSDRCEFT